METVERSKCRDRRLYAPEFKSEIVGRCRAGDRSIAEVARDFDLRAPTCRRPGSQTDIPHARGPPEGRPDEPLTFCYRGTTVTGQRSPGAPPSLTSAVSSAQSSDSANATYEAS